MKFTRSKQLYIGIGVTLVFVLVSIIIPDLLSDIDKSILTQEYRIRGEAKVDSSIVILYLGNDDIASLGGWPLKRSYYALIINALHEVGVKAIGIDIAFTEPDIHGSEYDELLADVMKQSGNVILGGYFRALSDDTLNTPEITDDSLPNRFTIKTCGPFQIPRGINLSTPIRLLMDAAAGFGHTVISSDFDVPIVIGIGSGRYVPAFAYKVFLNAFTQQAGRVRKENNSLQIPGSPNGNISVNYLGGVKSLNMFSVIEFLKSYNIWKSGGKPSQSIEQIKGAIVLIGIIAEGRSNFISTPFAQQFPSICIHATFIHNALHDNFIRRTPLIFEHLLILLVGLLCTLLMVIKKELSALLGVSEFLLIVVITSFYLFSVKSYVVPLGYPLFTGMFVTAAMLMYKHKVVRERADVLDQEKNRITKLLQEKELKLGELEKELSSTQHKERENHHTQMIEEAQKYQQEISRLKDIAADLQPLQTTEETPIAVRKEFSSIIYQSGGPMEEIVSIIKKIAEHNTTVLLLGESGTGKELVARALHEHSRRKDKPFIAVNCGALTETLLESELFGHERGAFTGAAKEKAGRFELADGGTILLDEVGETSEAFQVKLLRVLQDGTLERVGSTKTLKVDVRVIAATNKNLSQAVAEKKFREDLFYRLNVFPIQLPPLRERIDDIPILAEHFISLEDSRMKCSASAMEALMRNEWKGNIRELQSLVKRAVLMAKSDGRLLLRLKDFPAEITNPQNSALDLEQQIIKLLREKKFSRSSISETADDVGGLNRGTVAEYFRGYCFKAFVESRWDISAATQSIALTQDAEVCERVEKKLHEYLNNAIESVEKSKSIEQAILTSKPKYKNLPQRYHPYLDEIITSAYKREWALK